MTDELTDAPSDDELDAIMRLHGPHSMRPDEPAATIERLVAALRSARAKPKYSGDWEEAEIALRDVLDADDALEVLQTLQGLGFASAAELERERTQNRELRAAAETMIEAWTSGSHLMEVDRAIADVRAALSTQGESVQVHVRRDDGPDDTYLVRRASQEAPKA